MEHNANSRSQRTPWNKTKMIGQKPPLKLKEIWAILIRPQLTKKVWELAMFNLAIVAAYKILGYRLVGGGHRQSASILLSMLFPRQRPTGNCSSTLTNSGTTPSTRALAEMHSRKVLLRNSAWPRRIWTKRFASCFAIGSNHNLARRVPANSKESNQGHATLRAMAAFRR